MDIKNPKPFENPDAGLFLGTIIDISTKEKVPSKYMGQPRLNDKVTLHWVLNKVDNTPALDSEGKQFILRDGFNAAMYETSNLYKRIVQVIGALPPVIEKTEQLEALLIGRSGQLFLIKAPNPKDPKNPYTNINGVAPLGPGQVSPVAPAGYVRIKDRPPKAQPTAPTAQAAPAAQTQPTAQAAPAATPAPVSGNIAF